MYRSDLLRVPGLVSKALLVLTLLGTGPALAAPSAEKGEPAGKTDADAGKTEILTPMAFALKNAAMAGSMQKCEPRAATAIHDCMGVVLQNWSSLTNAAPLQSMDKEVVQVIWNTQFNAAFKSQSSDTPPMSCTQAIALAQAASLWHLCPSPWK